MSNLRPLLEWCSGPDPELCMGLLYLVLRDQAIPVSERVKFLSDVLLAAPDENHRHELTRLVSGAVVEGLLEDIRNYMQESPDSDTVQLRG